VAVDDLVPVIDQIGAIVVEVLGNFRLIGAELRSVLVPEVRPQVKQERKARAGPGNFLTKLGDDRPVVRSLTNALVNAVGPGPVREVVPEASVARVAVAVAKQARRDGSRPVTTRGEQVHVRGGDFLVSRAFVKGDRLAVQKSQQPVMCAVAGREVL